MITEEQESFILLLIRTRERRGITRRALADETGLFLGTISRCEYGINFPLRHNLVVWANFLGLEIPDAILNSTRTGRGGVAQCPSPAAYQRHMRRGEDPGPCGCRAAMSAYVASVSQARRIYESEQPVDTKAAGRSALIQKLKELRLELGLSRHVVDRLAGLPAKTIRQYELGWNMPKDKNLKKWASAFHIEVPASLLYGDDGSERLKACPSAAAYQRHLREGTDPGPCGCRRANTDKAIEWKRERRRRLLGEVS